MRARSVGSTTAAIADRPRRGTKLWEEFQETPLQPLVVSLDIDQTAAQTVPVRSAQRYTLERPRNALQGGIGGEDTMLDKALGEAPEMLGEALIVLIHRSQGCVTFLDECTQRLGGEQRPVPRQEMIIEDINDNSRRMSAPPEQQTNAFVDQRMRVCVRIDAPMVQHTGRDPLSEQCSEPLVGYAHEIGQDTAQTELVGVVSEIEMREEIHGNRFSSSRGTKALAPALMCSDRLRPGVDRTIHHGDVGFRALVRHTGLDRMGEIPFHETF